jgi:hypothetical protein
VFENLTLSSWVGIRDDCPISYQINGSDDVEFVCGSGRKTFEFVFSAGALRTFVDQSAEALDKMAAIDESAEVR